MYRKQLNCVLIVAFIIAFSPVSTQAKTTTVTLRVKGMTCGGCATAVEEALKSTEGVEDAQVSYKRGVAIIKYDHQKVTIAKLRTVINNIGFTCDELKSRQP